MKLRQVGAAAALMAAAAAGFGTNEATRAPGDVGLQDEVKLHIVATTATPATQSESPAMPRNPHPPSIHALREMEIASPPSPGEPTLTPVPEASPDPEPHARRCLEDRLVVLTPEEMGLFGDPLRGWHIPASTVDPRLVDGLAIAAKAGTAELYANLLVEVLDGEDGHQKDLRVLPNILVDNGKELGIRMLVGGATGDGFSGTCSSQASCGNLGTCTSPAKFNYIGIGDNSPVVLDVSTTSGLSREFSVTYPGSYARQKDDIPGFNSTKGQALLVVTFGANVPAATVSVLESGVFSAASSGTMLARRQFSAVNKNAADVLQLTWTLTLQ